MAYKLCKSGKNTVSQLLEEQAEGNEAAALALLPLRTKYLNVYNHLCKNPVSDEFKLTDKTQEIALDKNTSAKAIRSCLMASRYHNLVPINIQKSYYAPNVKEENMLTILSTIRRLTSVRHRNMILRMLNGDVLTKSKLSKMNLADSPNCATCNVLEDREHLLFECPRTKSIWSRFYQIVKEVTGRTINLSLENILCLGNHASSLPIVTISVELCMRISSPARPELSINSLLTIIKSIVSKEGRKTFKKGGNEWVKWKIFLQNQDR
jgi:hypothetical protein